MERGICMDEILFVNEYSRTKDTLKEAYQYWYFRRPIAVSLYVIVVLNILMQAFFLFNDYYVDPLNVVLTIFIGILFASLYFIQLHSSVKKDSQLSHGGEMKAHIAVADDRFYLDAQHSDYYVALSDVNYAFETKNYVMLVLKSTRLMIIFHKDGFTTGDLDGFRAFLKEKNIKVKGQKK